MIDSPRLTLAGGEGEWQFQLTVRQAWDAMLADCEAAESSIDFEQYIFRTRKIGKRFLALFRRKARQGVRVRLLCDMFGSATLYFSLARWRLKRAGVELIFYNPMLPWKWFGKCGPFPRDHRKIMVVDGKVAYTGGVCIDQDMEDWRDTHIRITGDVVEEFAFTFDSIWEATLKDRCGTRIPPQQRDGDRMLYLNEPVLGRPMLRERFLDRLEQTRERVYVTTPYFVPASRFVERVCALVNRGIDVRIMAARSNLFSYILGRREAGRFLERGARYFIYQPTMLHAKTLLIDDDFAAVGSFNVDNLSFYRNQEADVVTEDRAVAAELARQFEADTRNCREFTFEDWKARSRLEKFAAHCLLPLRRYM